MKKLCCMLLIIHVFAICQGQKYLSDWPMLMRSTVMLLQPLKSNMYTSGSGTIVEKSNRFFLLTAEHISITLDTNAIIIFSDEDSKPRKYALNSLLKTNLVKFTSHELADIACIEVIPIDTFLLRVFRSYALDEDHIPEYNLESHLIVNREYRLLFLGYPLISKDWYEYFVPFTFRTFPSIEMVRLPRADSSHKISKFFVTENPSVQGYSGGPVFEGEKGGEYILRGIVHGTFLDNTGGKMALITPTEYVLDVLKKMCK